jgi:hypothetical protein
MSFSDSDEVENVAVIVRKGSKGEKTISQDWQIEVAKFWLNAEFGRDGFRLDVYHADGNAKLSVEKIYNGYGLAIVTDMATFKGQEKFLEQLTQKVMDDGMRLVSVNDCFDSDEGADIVWAKLNAAKDKHNVH